MFDRNVFLRKNFGDSMTKILNNTMMLLDSKDYNIINPLDIINGDKYQGTIKTTCGIDIEFVNGRKDLTFTIKNDNCSIFMQASDGEPIYYLYLQNLIDGGIVRYESTKNGIEDYGYYSKETCDCGQITLDSNFIELNSEGFLPDRHMHEKNRKCNVENLSAGLGHLAVFKNKIEAQYARNSK